MASPQNERVLYDYNPSLVAAAIFIVLFFFTTLIHIDQAIRSRTFYLAPLIIGGFFEWIGYLGRTLAHDHLQDLGVFIFQVILLLLAPALFAGTIYMILGRIIRLVKGEHHSVIEVKWLTATFVCGDVLAFMVQTTGGGLMSKPQYFLTGEHLIIGGLLLQITFFGIFIVSGGLFHHRVIRGPTSASRQVLWQRHMYALYVASTLILIRSIFRTVEFSGGYNGFLMRHEVLFYVFDSFLMLGVMACFNLVHPGEIMGKDAPCQPSTLGVEEGDAVSLDSVNQLKEMKMARV